MSPFFKFSIAETELFFALTGTNVSNLESKLIVPALVKNFCCELKPLVVRKTNQKSKILK